MRRPAPAEPAITIGDYRRLNEIGKGSFAMVYRGVHVSKGALVAIKSVNLSKLSRKLKENLQSEVKILRELHHPHIVSLFECKESKMTAHLIMEYCELGDLSTFIRKRATLADHETTKDMIRKYPNPTVGGLNEVIARHFLKQIASGLQWIRKRNFLHRDIKPQNLLLVPSKAYQEKHKGERPALMSDDQVEEPPSGIASLPSLKIADFGFARFLPSLSLAETLCGSPLYMAPEILRYEKYDAQADLWSTGTVTYEMIVGKPPFRAQNHVELIAKIDKNDDRIKFPEGLVVSSGMKAIIRALLKKKPTERIGYDHFFDHSVIKEDIPGLAPEDKPQEPLSYNLASRIKSTRPSEVLGASTDLRRSSQTSQDQISVSPRSRPTSISGPSQGSPKLGNRRLSAAAADYQTRPTERRPTLTGHATAPAGKQEGALATFKAGRNQSSPSSSQLKDKLDRDRRRSSDRTLQEIRERADQDIAFERDVVFVEKRAVEVNALADAFENSPEVRAHQNAVVRRTTSTSSPYSTTAPQTSMRPWPTPKQLPGHTRQRSLDKHILGRSPTTSATSAISKAINMASFRVLGIGSSPPNQALQMGTGYNPFPVYPTLQGSGLLIGDGTKGVDSKDEDMRIALLSEKLAHRSSVIFDFAEVKYQQLMPIRPADVSGGANKAVDDFEDDEDLTVDAIVTVAEEALVLYVHVMGILQKVFDVTGNWFYYKRHPNANTSPQSAPVRTASVAPKINSVVQWARKRFNECLEKSDFVAIKLLDAQQRLPSDHPGHPSNHPVSSLSSVTTSVGASADNINLTSGITAEKLMYDRAVEMSRAAAINELTQEDMEGSERSYRTAIHMLEAVLDDDERDVLGHRLNRRDDETVNGLENEDRATVEQMLQYLRTRLRSLRKKLEISRSNRRLSSGYPPSGGNSRASPGTTPVQPARSSPRQ
ncbi:kinase-like protein [Microthyrium microscopicum]|uniref:non-specific serine/threonine protein kinase n=1 Tax=Microthyrium microscopicum TaxID=703497 RepID=A0A6A6UGQ0_9PEZI|nr:kinase-like protein [Microthyrium microscopicum]